jgi:hypothetical protein
VAYTVDPKTRTVAARVEILNPDLKLKPGMYVHAVVRLPVGAVTILYAASQPASSQPAAAAVTGKEYYCTMHPSVVRDAPGDCPICGMALVERPKSSAASQPVQRLDTKPFVQAYLHLMAAYVADKADAEALTQLTQATQALAAQATGDTQAALQALATTAEQLRGKGLKEQRSLLKDVNARVVEFLQKNPPVGQKLFVANCPMAKADWVQDKEEIFNPYYGSGMLHCGSITGPIEPATGDERSATGYYCPIYPDRLFDVPQHCPVDNFPTHLARIEKVLAVPESAVINTGTRRIVYRESAAGVFDMVEVQLGNRAGEFFPVLSGLKAGDKVATPGAFLVDAENRLNPGASAQYFGASGGPQSGEHQH